MRILGALLAVLLVVGVVFTKLEGGITLLFGWIPFLGRVLPRITVDWPSVWVGVVALTLFAAGVHAVGWTTRKPSAPGDAVPRWRVRWTISVVALVVLLFAAGISIIGAVHQVTWLARSDRFGQTIGGGRDSNTNLELIGLGFGNYASNGKLLPSGTYAGDGTMLHGWETRILAYMSYSPDGIDMKKPWNDPVNRKYFKCIIPEFINPGFRTAPLQDGDGYGLNHYSANSHVLTPNKSMKVEDITDGTANTLLLGEVNADFRPWGHPNNARDPTAGINTSRRGFGGAPGSGGATFLMADGSTRFLSQSISPEVLRALSTPNGGETVNAEE
jgi:hypothetical protein